ncbi:MAG: 30S ribosomal protein S20 [Patescibacteria group bacterium]|nr:30S ribosomal protein S20 [Patescibacteria group bacterium]
MPIKKAAKKFIKTSARKRERNLKAKERVRSLVKKTRGLAKENRIEKAREAFSKAVKAIDKAAQKGVLKKNTAARKKSRLSRLLRKK